MFKTGDIYRIIEDAMQANQIYYEDSKRGDGSTDTYETDTEMVYGEDAHMLVYIKHKHEHFPWRPGDDNVNETVFKIKVEMV